MDLSNINFFAVVTATLSTFAVGWLWYGPLFGQLWMKTVGLTEAELAEANMLKIFGLAFIFELIMAVNLAIFLTGSSEAAEQMTGGLGAFYGFLTGFGWVFFALAVTGLFERRSWKYILINGGYWCVGFTLMGLIIGSW
ncbi:DUF1761 domain-containing protein [Fodinibius sediminis]|uniref:DUF1761 domain-containing protein n=1 Tax=Fodinibius sediminis TaxID=1214077 RepID=A0A521F2U8_9BACT|nr:DUF1761 domain-containing protein [Fodinibius sediminis]SMO90514.1 Protein of unknown function [Fodinibius sediminis]